MKKTFVMTALAVLAATSVSVQAAGDATAGQTKAAVCGACHGMDGNSPNPVWPSLAGQHASYIVKQLKEFKAGDRKDPTMSPMAAPLSDQDMEDVAAFFSSQARKEGAADATLAPAGKAIYQGGNLESGVSACMACHTPNGSGNEPAKFPNLGYQHAAYTAKQLKDFRSGTRANDLNGMMRGVAAKMTDAEIDAVAAYTQGLH